MTKNSGMAKTNMVQITMRGNAETKELFRELFEASGANSHGEFLQKLLETFAQASENSTVIPKAEPQIIEVEKPLAENQVLIDLNALQFFALKQAVLSYPDFADQQNNIIDSLKRGKPWYYSGDLYAPEFVNAFIRNISLSKIAPELRESAIIHNMSAFLVNLFMMNVIEENLSTISIKANHLKAFARKQNEDEKAKKNLSIPVENEQYIN